MLMGTLSVSVSSAICRICRSGEHSIAYDKSNIHEPLISPCFCRGTIGLYHRSCLERWLVLSNRSVCEICHFTYQTERRYRTFCEFIASRDSHIERRNLVTDIACFLFFTPIIIGCIILCLVLVAQTRDFPLWNNVAAYQAITLSTLSVLLSMAYSAWLIVIIVFHIRTYFDWRIRNEEILVIDQESTRCSWKTVNRVRKQRRKRLCIHAMRLLCFDLHSFLHDLCRTNLSAASVSSANSGNFNSTTYERHTSFISSNTLDMNYDDFVHHLQPEDGAISVIGSCQQTVVSTPVPNDEAFGPLQIFEYPSVNSHLTRSNIAI